jgi:hypothetical protein
MSDSVNVRSLANLALGRGKKKPLGNQEVKIKLSANDKERLEQIAKALGCCYANKGSISDLLTKIADGTFCVISTPPYLSLQTSTSPRKSLDTDLTQIHYSNEHNIELENFTPSDLLDADLTRRATGNDE